MLLRDMLSGVLSVGHEDRLCGNEQCTYFTAMSTLPFQEDVAPSGHDVTLYFTVTKLFLDTRAAGPATIRTSFKSARVNHLLTQQGGFACWQSVHQYSSLLQCFKRDLVPGLTGCLCAVSENRQDFVDEQMGSKFLTPFQQGQ